MSWFLPYRLKMYPFACNSFIAVFLGCINLSLNHTQYYTTVKWKYGFDMIKKYYLQQRSQKPRRHTAVVVRAGLVRNDQAVSGARHGHIKETAFLFDLIRQDALAGRDLPLVDRRVTVAYGKKRPLSMRRAPK